MDKSRNGKTITIKINGKNRSYEETKAEMLEDGQKDHEKELDYFASKEAAASKEAVEDDSFDWILPDESFESDIKEYTIVKQPKQTNKKGIGAISKNFKKNNRNGLLTSVFIAVFFAILLGTSFGLIMLKLVTTEKAIETNETVVAQSNPEEEKEPVGSVTLALEPLSTYVIQGGVFSNIEAAKKIQEESIQNGVPAQIVEINDQAFLYLSVADSIEHAKTIGTQLSGKGIEVFAKPITLGGKSLEGLQSEEKKLLEAVPIFYEILATSAAEASVASEIPEALAESAEKQAAVLADIKVNQMKNEKVLSIRTELQSAMEQMRKYKQSPNPEVLTKLQQHLLGFLAAYQSL